MSTSYSMWLVVLIPYSLSPWKCMKMSNFFISLLILDPRSLGRKIDDSLNGQFFKLYAVLLWTINDFPAYGDLSEWSTKGYQACLICIRDRSSLRIKEKISFMEHRRYLQGNHIWRRRCYTLILNLLLKEPYALPFLHVAYFYAKCGSLEDNVDVIFKGTTLRINEWA
ncbi:uncharacterized protein E6C27_scaffold437G00930 [Cucumis melo var. makuwa]|uniref:Uncharacterized protein n=1 Tax=Cucumis melo var. makuwa TaxID=1194695 RepID=A0A5A7UKI9_CUCMM|nr:uncharacterized protein E6C27_scaffold437G00930 [Cucumis melo var. makuwa]